MRRQRGGYAGMAAVRERGIPIQQMGGLAFHAQVRRDREELARLREIVRSHGLDIQRQGNVLAQDD